MPAREDEGPNHHNNIIVAQDVLEVLVEIEVVAFKDPEKNKTSKCSCCPTIFTEKTDKDLDMKHCRACGAIMCSKCVVDLQKHSKRVKRVCINCLHAYEAVILDNQRLQNTDVQEFLLQLTHLSNSYKTQQTRRHFFLTKEGVNDHGLRGKALEAETSLPNDFACSAIYGFGKVVSKIPLISFFGEAIAAAVEMKQISAIVQEELNALAVLVAKAVEYITSEIEKEENNLNDLPSGDHDLLEVLYNIYRLFVIANHHAVPLSRVSKRFLNRVDRAKARLRDSMDAIHCDITQQIHGVVKASAMKMELLDKKLSENNVAAARMETTLSGMTNMVQDVKQFVEDTQQQVDKVATAKQVQSVVDKFREVTEEYSALHNNAESWDASLRQINVTLSSIDTNLLQFTGGSEEWQSMRQMKKDKKELVDALQTQREQQENLISRLEKSLEEFAGTMATIPANGGGDEAFSTAARNLEGKMVSMEEKVQILLDRNQKTAEDLLTEIRMSREETEKDKAEVNRMRARVEEREDKVREAEETTQQKQATLDEEKRQLAEERRQLDVSRNELNSRERIIEQREQQHEHLVSSSAVEEEVREPEQGSPLGQQKPTASGHGDTNLADGMNAAGDVALPGNPLRFVMLPDGTIRLRPDWSMLAFGGSVVVLAVGGGVQLFCLMPLGVKVATGTSSVGALLYQYMPKINFNSCFSFSRTPPPQTPRIFIIGNELVGKKTLLNTIAGADIFTNANSEPNKWKSHAAVLRSGTATATVAFTCAKGATVGNEVYVSCLLHSVSASLSTAYPASLIWLCFKDGEHRIDAYMREVVQNIAAKNIPIFVVMLQSSPRENPVDVDNRPSLMSDELSRFLELPASRVFRVCAKMMPIRDTNKHIAAFGMQELIESSIRSLPNVSLELPTL